MTTSDTHAVRLGRALRDIRTSLPTDGPTPTTQSDVARRVYVGGKGVVSLFENGKRIPSADVVQRYCALVDIDPATLLTLRDLAAEESLACAANASDDAAEPAGGPIGVRSGLGATPMRRRALVLGVGSGALASAIVVALMRREADDPTSSASIATPHGVVGVTSPVEGTVRGWTSHQLWIDVQGLEDPNHHPADRPCVRWGTSFAYEAAYVGGESDSGKMFRISLLAVRSRSSAQRALVEYGRRPPGTKDMYAGLPHLPTGVTVADSIVVRRR